MEVRKSTSRQRAAEAKVGFLMLQTGIKGTSTKTTEVVSDGVESANYVTRTKATEKKTLISGDEDYGVSVQLKRRQSAVRSRESMTQPSIVSM